MKYYPIHDKVYRKNFHLVVNETEDDFYRWIVENNQNKQDEELKKLISGGVKGLTIFEEDKPYYYIYVKEFDWKIDDQATLVHELNHFVDFVFEKSGVPINTENTEVRAYYFEYLFTKCWQALKHLNRMKGKHMMGEKEMKKNMAVKKAKTKKKKSK